MSPCVHFGLMIVFIVHSTVINFNNHFVISKMMYFSFPELFGLIFSNSSLSFLVSSLFRLSFLLLFSCVVVFSLKNSFLTLGTLWVTK